MSYSSGSVSSIASLVSAITNACTLAGWTLTGSVLSKGGVNVRLAAAAANYMTVEGANDTAFTDACPWIGYTKIDVWPIYYRIFINTSPDSVFVHIRHPSLTVYEHLYFGMIENKVGAWTGGNFFSAARSATTFGDPGIGSFSTYGRYDGGYGRAGGPFCRGDTSYGWQRNGEGMACDIDGAGWVDGTENSGLDSKHVWWTNIIHPLAYRSPNQWNGQIILHHPHLYKPRAGGRLSRVGTLPHMRLARITNYEPYDIITLGSDRWMVMPWVQKNTAQPDPGAGAQGSGTWGAAIRYDGP